MSDEARCEFARSGAADGTAGGRSRSPGGEGRPDRRATLRATDGVRIEAAYDRYAGPDPTGPGADDPGAIVLAHGFSGAADRPALRRAAQVFAQYGAVITFSFRGHGGSGGHSTVGDREVLDLAAAVRWARSLGHAHVTTVGFSMGGSVVVRHGALYRPDGRGTGDAEHTAAHERRTGAQPHTAPPLHTADQTGQTHRTDRTAHSAHADAVVAVSAPARWYYRGTAPMRRLHWVIQRPVGRIVSRFGLRTRVHHRDWDPVPLSPVAAAPVLSPTPFLVVHGDQDPYFPLDHPRSLAAAADPDRTELWIVPGFGHAENAAAPPLLRRIGAWTRARSATATAAAAAARHDGARTTDG
ncbi:MAG: alpha/beta fold hydrolase [Streptomyces sp.]|uniref:alpha/beta fold hydrolase n=1 Tax=Streptomyces sp. TaxID=1931 RepID=UPI003D6A7026